MNQRTGNYQPNKNSRFAVACMSGSYSYELCIPFRCTVDATCVLDD